MEAQGGVPSILPLETLQKFYHFYSNKLTAIIYVKRSGVYKYYIEKRNKDIIWNYFTYNSFTELLVLFIVLAYVLFICFLSPPAVEAQGGVPSIRPLETLHNALSLKHLDEFLRKSSHRSPTSSSFCEDMTPSSSLASETQAFFFFKSLHLNMKWNLKWKYIFFEDMTPSSSLASETYA